MILVPPPPATCSPQVPVSQQMLSPTGLVQISMRDYMQAESPLSWQNFLIERLSEAGLPVSMEPLPFLFGFTPSITVAISRALQQVGATQFYTEADPYTGMLIFRWL